MNKDLTFSASNTRVIVRMMKIIDDVHSGAIKMATSKYLKEKKERLWFFSFMKKTGLIDNMGKWTGPDIEVMKNNGHYNQFIYNLYNQRLKYASSLKKEITAIAHDEPEDIDSEIIGIEPMRINKSTMPIPVISIPDDGMFLLEVGSNKYQFMINSNSSSCSFHVLDNQEPD